MNSIILLIGLWLLLHGIMIYFIGSHNVDLGHNIKLINTEYGLDLVDITSEFNVWNATTMYITGSNQQNEGLFFSIVGALLFGISFERFRFR